MTFCPLFSLPAVLHRAEIPSARSADERSEAEAEVGKCEMGWVHLEIENATLLIARRHAIYCR